MRAKIILLTAASHEVGQLAAKVISHSGHIVYAGMDLPLPGNPSAAGLTEYAADHGVDIRPILMPLTSADAVEMAIRGILNICGRIDAVIHSADINGHGPTEAYTPVQLRDALDLVLVGAQRVNRAALPAMRAQRSGQLVWVSASSVGGGVLPFRALPHIAKGALDALAVHYAQELAPWGIESTIIVPGMQNLGSANRLDETGPDDHERVRQYDDDDAVQLAARAEAAIARLLEQEPDVGPIAGAILEAIDTPQYYRPLRLHVDPIDDGASAAFGVIDHLRAELLYRLGLPAFLQVAARRHEDAEMARSRSRAGFGTGVDRKPPGSILS